MTDYGEYSRQEFRTRQEAESWAEEEKEKIKQSELGVIRISISYNERNKLWEARLLLPVS